MDTELTEQLREFADSAAPITLAELRRVTAFKPNPERVPVHKTRISHGHRVLAAAAVVVLVAAVGAVAASRISNPASKSATGSIALSPGAIRLVDTSTSTALASGTALMNITQSQGGVTTNTWDSEVTFSGPNVDMATTWTQTPISNPGEPTIPAQSSIFDNRVVDGTSYRTLNGQWSVYSPTDASSSISFPDPRTFVADITPSADLVSVGTETVNGVNLTHYQAKNPSVLGNVGIAGLGSPRNTGFNAWVDSQHVVQRMTLDFTGTPKTCFTVTSPSTLPTQCTSAAITGHADISFSDIGAPETISAPTVGTPGS